jgi:hypothetical protein
MIVLAYLARQCTKFHASGWTCWLLSFHFKSFILPDAISQWMRQRSTNRFCANLRKSTMETLAVIRREFREEDVSHIWVFKWHAWFRQTGKKKARQVKNKVKNMLLSFFDIKEMFTENSSWQAKRSIPHTTVTFYSDCLKMCEDFTPNFGDKRTGCCILTMHCLTLSFSPGNFWPKIVWLSPPPTPLIWIGPLQLSVSHHIYMLLRWSR